MKFTKYLTEAVSSFTYKAGKALQDNVEVHQGIVVYIKHKSTDKDIYIINLHDDEHLAITLKKGKLIDEEYLDEEEWEEDRNKTIDSYVKYAAKL